MIPIRDDNPTARLPLVTFAVTLGCGFVFAQQLGYFGGRGEMLVRDYALIPARFLSSDLRAQIVLSDAAGAPVRLLAEVSPLAQWLPARVAEGCTLLTCTFLHGGWLHLLGNVWVLHVFGDNVEERFGSLRYLLLYLACGIGASLAHLASAPDSAIPTVGASGAIAGVMGAYLVLYPGAMVLTWIPFVLPIFLHLPAVVFLGLWLAMQLFHGLVETSAVDGVAWWAHIGGFAMGMAAALLLRLRGALRPRQRERLVFASRRRT